MSIQSISGWLEEASEKYMSLSEYILYDEEKETGMPKAEIIEKMERTLDVMQDAASQALDKEVKSVSGMSGGDAHRLYEYANSKRTILGGLPEKALYYAVSTSEVNASMGVIVAAPTAGSCGIIPGTLLAVAEEFGVERNKLIDALLVAGGVGKVIALKASLAGAEAGCQAECGSASAMAAAGVGVLLDAEPEQCMEAAALALKNSLGLACDPIAGLVEVPCIKRNGIFAVHSLAAADMALAGVKSKVPLDEVIEAMYAIGISMPAGIRETAAGGLAITPTGCRIKQELF